MTDLQPADAERPAGAPRRRILGWAFRGALAVAILAALFAAVSFEAVLTTLSAAKAAPLLGALPLALAGPYGVALRLRRLLAAQGIEVPIRQLFEINLATLFYGLFLPAGNFAGIAIRFYRMAREHKSYAGIAVALVFDRLVATIALSLVGVLFWLLEWPLASWPAFALMAGVLAALAALEVVLFLDLPLWPRARLPLASDWLRRRLESLRAAVRLAWGLPGSTLAYVAFNSILLQLLGIAIYVLIARALDLDLPWITIAWTRSAAMLLTILPVSIAGLGVREGALVALLAPYGTAAAEAVAFGLAAFAITNLMPALLGGLIELRRLLWSQAAHPRHQP